MDKNYEEITCKVALFTPDHSQVIIVEYTGGEGFGLPGGHLEKGEEPELACVREVMEELGIALRPDVLILKKAWRHLNGKIVLGYAGVISRNTALNTGDASEVKAVHWMDVDKIADNTIFVGTYKQFILDNARNHG